MRPASRFRMGDLRDGTCLNLCQFGHFFETEVIEQRDDSPDGDNRDHGADTDADQTTPKDQSHRNCDEYV